jgi:hypothetical protein
VTSVTPLVIDEDILRLVRLIGVNGTPVYVDLHPELYSKVCECFPLVAEKIARNGGSQVLGWQLWKSDILVEGEFHAVWRSAAGDLVDITPKQIAVERILFVPDLHAKYIGAQVDNVRLNITQNRLVDDFIRIAKAIFRLENKGERAIQYELSLPPEELEFHSFLKKLKTTIYAFIIQGGTRNSPCFCASGIKYKHCHGQKLEKFLNRI